jgi:flagellar biosynthetic protein FlhB
MAKDDKTEAPTPKRRKESRKKGQMPKSADLNGAVVVLAGLIAISAMGPAVVNGAGSAMRYVFGLIAHSSQISTGAGLKGLFDVVLHTMLVTVGPIAGVCAGVGVLINVAQVGVHPSMKAIKPDIKRINPATGAKNVFGSRIIFETGKAITKVAVVGIVVAIALIPQLTTLGANVGTTPGALGKLASSSAISIGQRAAFAYLIIGIIDLVYQRRKFEKSLKMSKHEVKEEFKSHSSPPEIRAAQRRRQMQIARGRMMASVPQADVVVTNPTHYAAALSYDGTRPAPVLLAKGKGHIALQIRRIAEENGVPVMSDPPLARAVCASVEVGQMIPEELFAAVAQVLAFVYRIANRKRAAAA